ncbi:D-arabinono-1,4-lactone oxidase [Compostimonas suwonensis]|uniref:FAD-linked oxidoreductase n=1 Tax=Compostimonas suwonensis TaxID=1048394 RepID=A0A2M9BW84_9MICO|nr:D-arabinono-1,4-lactone oxidase [Compostimonas suwonensis]PJJ62195.1 FAD-linked oxidoreductase [Compostimonas suwonensis]
MTAANGQWRNWSRGESARPSRVERPASAGAVQRAVQAAVRTGERVKAVGAGHSFSGIAVPAGILLELTELSGLVGVDAARSRATLAAGTRLRDVPALLAPHGLAMQNLGDIDAQTISGAISTGTHGTGTRFGGIATQVVGLALVDGTGGLVRISEEENAELLPAAALGLGALGIIVEVTLQCVPAFVLHTLESPEPLEQVLESFDERAETSDHFEFYWFAHTDRALTKTNTRLPVDTPLAPRSTMGRLIVDEFLSNGLFRVTCNLGRFLPAAVVPVNRIAERVWSDLDVTDLSHRVFVADRSVRFREMEYALPREVVVDAFREVVALVERRRWRISFPIEVRVAAADELWMSTASGRASGYIAVHRFFRESPHEYFRAVEEIMLAYDGRPHWGKMHYRDADSLRAVYPRFDEFLAVRDRLDPGRLFSNRYLKGVLGS